MTGNKSRGWIAILRQEAMDVLFPPRCPLCDRVRLAHTAIACPACVAALSHPGPAVCMKCGKTLRDETEEYCEDCRKRGYHYQSGKALWTYEGAIRASLMRYKFSGMRSYADFYAEQAEKTVGTWLQSRKADCLVPVPISEKRLRERGYNQATEFAKALGRRQDIPVAENLLVRNGEARAQKELGEAERLRILMDAFAVNQTTFAAWQKKMTRGSVILIDDIYTTGSTVEACTRALQKAGISNVSFLCICIGD